MQLIRGSLFIAFILLSAAPVYAQNTADSKGATASVRGRVLVDGEPVENVLVQLKVARVHASDEDTEMTRTDVDGRFEFDGLAQGTYEIEPVLIGRYCSSCEKNVRVVTVGASERVDVGGLAMVKGGVITGRVTRPDGRSVIDVEVALARPEQRYGSIDLPASRIARTDDRGVYRIFGLAPGEYIVSVALEFGGARTDLRYKTAYYGGTSDRFEARVVELAPGGEASGIDIVVAPPIQTYTATGRVVDADTGKPIPRIQVDARKQALSLAGGISEPGETSAAPNFFDMDEYASNENGEFRLLGLTPGTYKTEIHCVDAWGEEEYLENSITFEIVSSDISGLQIVLRRGASVSGTAVFENPGDRKLYDMRHLTLVAWSGSVLMLERDRDGQATKIGLDGTFRFPGLRPGRVDIGTSRRIEPTNLRVLRVERDGADVTKGFVVGEKETVMGIRVVLGYAKGSICGSIKVEGGTLEPGVALSGLLYRYDETGSSNTKGWELETTFEADAAGRFLVDGLFPGAYRVEFAAYDSRQDYANTIRSRASSGVVRVTDDKPVEVNLRLDLDGKGSEQP
jgi:hypothetical protein